MRRLWGTMGMLLLVGSLAHAGDKAMKPSPMTPAPAPCGPISELDAVKLENLGLQLQLEMMPRQARYDAAVSEVYRRYNVDANACVLNLKLKTFQPRNGAKVELPPDVTTTTTSIPATTTTVP